MAAKSQMAKPIKARPIDPSTTSITQATQALIYLLPALTTIQLCSAGSAAARPSWLVAVPLRACPLRVFNNLYKALNNNRIGVGSY
jgi:hypothetical protein